MLSVALRRHPGPVSAATQTAPSSTEPHIEGCPVFPPDNVWNTPVDKLPVNSHSGAYVMTMGPEIGLHPDFTASPFNGIPYELIHSDQPPVKVAFEIEDESDPSPYPVPPDAPIEGGADSDGDRHILLIDTDKCTLFELYQVHYQPNDTWKAYSGVKMDLRSNALRGVDKTSADAAGLPIFPGLVRYDEIEAGEIRHAIRFTVPKTQRAFIWPARHRASNITDPRYPPMGVRFRLRASVNISHYSKTNQIILTALKRYGMILADNGGPWFISGAPDIRWDESDLLSLHRISGRDFEAVDESSLMLSPDSAQVKRPATH
jgi:hypothetical protein